MNRKALAWMHFAVRASSVFLLVCAIDASAQSASTGASASAAASAPGGANVACILALKFQDEGIPDDREQAVKMLKAYLGRNDSQKISQREIQEALADEDLAVIRDEIVAMIQTPEPDER